MNLPVVLDVETLPLESALQAPYPESERAAPSNYKDPEKIAAWRENDRAKWQAERVKECSLTPRLGRVLCVGMALPCSDALAYSVPMAADEAAEPGVLRGFWQAMKMSAGRVVTWNGTWDLQFLVVRSLACGVEPTIPADVIRAWFRKYTVAPHFDVKAALTNWNPMDGHLDEWAALLGISAKQDGITGKDVYGLYRAGELSKIAGYCLSDVKATEALYRRVAPMFSEGAA